MESKKLIRITADDGGLTAEQDSRLLELAQTGGLTGISFFVTMSSKPALVEAFADRLTLSIGLHLDLTDGHSVAGADRIPSLSDSSGKFLGPRILMKRCLTSRAVLGELRCEIGAQLKAHLDRYGRLDHLDSHRHVHRFPIVARAIAESVAELKLSPRVRNLKRTLIHPNSSPGNTGALNYWMKDPRRLIGAFMKCRANRFIRKRGIPMGDGLLTPWPAIVPEAHDAPRQWSHAVASAPVGEWEANFHPGWNAGDHVLLHNSEFKAAWQPFSASETRIKQAPNKQT